MKHDISGEREGGSKAKQTARKRHGDSFFPLGCTANGGLN